MAIAASRFSCSPRGRGSNSRSDSIELPGDGTTVLLVEQNAHTALKVADWGYVLETGRLVLGGDATTLWSDERIRDAYLGGPQAKAPI